MFDRAGQAAQRASAGGWKDRLGRVGLIGRGALYAIVGLLALQLALGDVRKDTSVGGAVEWIASQPFGKFLLVALTLSLFALAAWRLLDAAMGDPVEGSEAKDRLEYAAKAALYLGFAVVALTATVSAWEGSASGSTANGEEQGQQATSWVLEWPGGRWIVGAAGAAVIAYGAYTVKQHTIDAEFLERLDASTPGWIEPAGRVGYAAKAMSLGLIGWFLLRAGLTYDPREARGLSGALQELATSGGGRVVLGAVALGFMAMGGFMLAEARFRRGA